MTAPVVSPPGGGMGDHADPNAALTRGAQKKKKNGSATWASRYVPVFGGHLW